MSQRSEPMIARRHNGITDLRKAAIHRMRDARRLNLAAAERPDGFLHRRGAVYLAGYAMECRLKAIAMEVHRCNTLEQLKLAKNLDERMVYTHRLDMLGELVPSLWERLRNDRATWADFANWVNRWRPDWRYDPRPVTAQFADRFLEAVERISKWLERNRG